MTTFRFPWLIYLVLLSYIIALLSCHSSNVRGDYKTKIRETNEGWYLFEYPASFNSDYSPRDSLEASIQHVVQTTTGSRLCVQTLNIFILNHKRGLANATMIIDNRISSIKASEFDFKFQLFKRSQIKVSGYHAESVEYWAVGGPPSILMSMDYRRWFQQELYIDHGDEIWQVGLYSLEDLTEEAKTEFDHLIHSIRILR